MGGESVGATHGDEEVGLSVSVDIASVYEERGLRVLLLNCSWGCERRNCDGAKESCNPKAEHTYHVHLLQMEEEFR